MVNNTTSLLSDPKVLKLFLYCIQAEGEVSIRQVQRDLGIASSSVHWQLGKLVDAGLVEKTQDSLYELSEEGKSVNSISLPVAKPFVLLSGKLIPNALFHLGFLISSLVFGIVLLFFDQFATLILLILVVFVEVILQFREYRVLKGETILSNNSN